MQSYSIWMKFGRTRCTNTRQRQIFLVLFWVPELHVPWALHCCLSFSLPELVTETFIFKVLLTFESLDERPFEWNLRSSIFTWFYLYLSILRSEIWDLSWIKALLRVKGLTHFCLHYHLTLLALSLPRVPKIKIQDEFQISFFFYLNKNSTMWKYCWRGFIWMVTSVSP